MIKFSYNKHFHSRIGINLFYILYGHECKTSITLYIFNTIFEIINVMIKDMNKVRESTKLAMKSAQGRVKHYVDNKRIFRKFKMSNKVFLNVTPNRSGLKLGKSRRLSPRFYGPFEIMKMIGQIAYELKLLENWRIHNVFHMRLLKKYVSDLNHILHVLPKAIVNMKLLAKPIKF